MKMELHMGKRSRQVQREDSDFEEDAEYEEPIVGDVDSIDTEEEEEEEGAEGDDNDDNAEDTDNSNDDDVEEEEDMDEDMEEDESEGDEQNEEDESDDDGENEERKNNEMEELEKEYEELRKKEHDLLKNLTRHKEEDLLKGQAVKNQRVLWDKCLEFRFLLQKPFSCSNRLPQDPIRSSFCDLDKDVSVAYSDLVTSGQKTLDSLLELQKSLVEKNPALSQATEGNSRPSTKSLQASKGLDEEEDEKWSQISQMQLRIAPFRDKSVDKWQRKTQVTTGAAAIKGKLHAFSQNISEQVAGYMRDPSRMIKRMQLRRSTVAIFGNVSKSFLPINFLVRYVVVICLHLKLIYKPCCLVATQVPEAAGSSNEEDANVDGDPELLDDSEFYQQLLKEFLETFDPSSSETALYAMKRLRPKKRKIVDRRASKSRKIRYNVHEKIVNFMAPQPMRLPSVAPALFDNLFGFRNQKPASEM
ncbi:Apoptosis-antagonizing transcription factor, C-terminal [Dillenia turbinata]|uniref:Apoptosis-antagonizing transcription factor, C-terminal n=1 Tax=Dillenia turbinata TaxID=194707 RepID=A0AAN8UKP5_9MAGN